MRETCAVFWSNLEYRFRYCHCFASLLEFYFVGTFRVFSRQQKQSLAEVHFCELVASPSHLPSSIRLCRGQSTGEFQFACRHDDFFLLGENSSLLGTLRGLTVSTISTLLSHRCTLVCTYVHTSPRRQAQAI